ncbi:MAG: DUF4926 domain-containing protein [Cyanobacteria bacterium J06627_28]
MTKFNLFDEVCLTKSIALTDFVSNALDPIGAACEGTMGTIVEVLVPGETFLVELLGDWVVSKPDGLYRATAEADGAFRETIGVETVQAEQMMLVHRRSAKYELLQLVENMPETLIEKV